MKKFVSLLAMGLLVVVSLMGCGSDSTQASSNEVPQIVTTPVVAKTYGVKMAFDLNSRNQVAKTVYGGGSTVLQSFKDEVTQVSIYVRTVDYGEVANFENLPIINGVFSSIREDGSSMINLPAGEYIIWVQCDNAAGVTRFSGTTMTPVTAEGPNNCVIDMALEDIYVDLAIMVAPGNFDKSDGQYDTGMRYSGSATTDDGRWFSSEQIAYADLSGVLHVTIAVNPLTSSKVWISVVDKDGITIVQAIDLEMLVAVAAERNNESYWYTYQKTDPINLTLNFPQ
jgi:hypothetical protein